MLEVFKRPEALTDVSTHYCPGCDHGIVHRLVAEAIDDLGVRERTVGVAPVGCAVFAYNYWNVDMIGAAHGRAPAVATGVKRVRPGEIVFSYQGDGDLAAIGTAEIVHAAARRENITVIFINNAVYGMTSGQMAPTSLVGQVTTTTPSGRDPRRHGFPVRVCELLDALEGPAYLARVAVNTPQNVTRARKAIKAAFECQVRGDGFALVEVLSTCPSSWGLSPVECVSWLEEHMIPHYPLGVLREPGADTSKPTEEAISNAR
jgi:2-oxoglutarate ferredoxin oxidoreductase subunit beta